MKLFSWKKKEKECAQCVALEERFLAVCDDVAKVMLILVDLDARLKKLETKKKPSAKKKRPQPVLKGKHN
jgi:hypothetical protein